MSFLACEDPHSPIALKNVPLIKGNQLVCFCGQAMVIKDKRNGRCSCAKNKCKLVIDKPAMVEWVTSGALPDLASYNLPICKSCEAVTLYAPLRNNKESSIQMLEPLFKCNCRSGRLPATYYSIKDYPEFYKQFDMEKLPIDSRPRPEDTRNLLPKLNIMDLPDA